MVTPFLVSFKMLGTSFASHCMEHSKWGSRLVVPTSIHNKQFTITFLKSKNAEEAQFYMIDCTSNAVGNLQHFSKNELHTILNHLYTLNIDLTEEIKAKIQEFLELPVPDNSEQLPHNHYVIYQREADKIEIYDNDVNAIMIKNSGEFAASIQYPELQIELRSDNSDLFIQPLLKGNTLFITRGVLRVFLNDKPFLNAKFGSYNCGGAFSLIVNYNAANPYTAFIIGSHLAWIKIRQNEERKIEFEKRIIEICRKMIPNLTGEISMSKIDVACDGGIANGIKSKVGELVMHFPKGSRITVGNQYFEFLEDWTERAIVFPES